MLYELVLARIGYRGPYTDHSDRASPTIEFPPGASERPQATFIGSAKSDGSVVTRSPSPRSAVPSRARHPRWACSTPPVFERSV